MKSLIILFLMVISSAVAQVSSSKALINQKGTLAQIPANCTPGQLFFATDQTPGNNTYGCTAGNVWTLQGDGTNTGTVTSATITAGSGISVASGGGGGCGPTTTVLNCIVSGTNTAVAAVNSSITTSSLGVQAICALHTDVGCLNASTDATAANCPAGTVTATCTFPTSITISANTLGSTVSTLNVALGALSTAVIPTSIIEIYLDSVRIYSGTATAGAAGTRSLSQVCSIAVTDSGASVPAMVGCSSASAVGTVNSFASNSLNTNAAPAIAINTTVSHVLKVSIAFASATAGNMAWLYGMRFSRDGVGIQGATGATGATGPQGTPGSVSTAGCGIILASAGSIVSGTGPCPSASVGGTADAITAVYSPVRDSLFTGEMLSFTPTAPNATTTPTFSPDGLTAHTIVKAGAAALAAGDIATNVAAILKYDVTGTRWELQNPQTASGQVYPGAGIANSTGSAWTTPYSTSGSGTVVPLATSPTLGGNVAFSSGASNSLLIKDGASQSGYRSQFQDSSGNIGLGARISTVWSMTAWETYSAVGATSFGCCDFRSSVFNGTTGVLQVSSTGGLNISSHNGGGGGGQDAGSGQDIGLDRDSAGVFGVTNGTSGTTAANYRALKLSALILGGTTFTATGLSVGTLVGGATAGKFTLGAGGAGTVVVTMGNSATAPTGWSCWANDQTTTTAIINNTASAATTATFNFPVTALNGDVINFGCLAY